ncbi:MAG: nitrous oxide reductase family maturation protein NosD [Thiotrichales bacterium]
MKRTHPLRFCRGWAVLGLLASGWAHALAPLQLFVELTPEHGVLRPPPGNYGGPVVIRKPMTLDGGAAVTLDGEGSGTVLTIEADGVTVRGMRLIGSGSSHDQVDAGIWVQGDGCRIEDNTIEDVLFGIHLQQADRNLIRGNRIQSHAGEVTLRGDGIRLWYSHENRIEGNTLTRVRDLVLANSNANAIVDNVVADSRIALQLMFSPLSEVRGNRVSHSHSGIATLYSNDVTIRGNRIQHLRERAGAALTVKDSSGVLIEDNEVLHCVYALTANAPVNPENVLTLRRNRLAYNDVACYFYGEKGGHVIQGNRFEHNMLDVLVSAPSSARANDWRGNYWDTYSGFDRDGDGFGDRAHTFQIYADRLWMDRPFARFFRGTPALSVLDFVERLIPFSAPEWVLRDPAPLMR